jgi:hypothetical protein
LIYGKLKSQILQTLVFYAGINFSKLHLAADTSQGKIGDTVRKNNGQAKATPKMRWLYALIIIYQLCFAF